MSKRKYRYSYSLDQKNKRLRKVVSRFDQDQQIIITAYLQNRQYNMTSNLQNICCLWRLHKFLNKKKLLSVKGNELCKFLKTLQSQGRSARRSLSSFYNWAVKTGLIESSPYKMVDIAVYKRKCIVCNNLKIYINKDNICIPCSREPRNKKNLKILKAGFSPKTEYNKYLFDLYLKHLEKLSILPTHMKVAECLKTYFQEHRIPIIKNWLHVKKIKIDFESRFGKMKRLPIEKIAFKLQELKIIPAHEHDFIVNIENVLTSLDKVTENVFRQYIKSILGTRRTLKTAGSFCYEMRRYIQFLKAQKPSCDLFTAKQENVESFLATQKDPSGSRSGTINKFYKWAKRNKLCFHNPLDNIIIKRHERTLLICSPEDRQKITTYIQSPNSEPEKALMLALALYWGLKAVELSYSTIEIETDRTIKIILYRKELSFGNKRHKREQILKLPNRPKWLMELQKRFIESWEPRYAQTLKSFPLQPLILPKHLRYNRPLRTSTLFKRFLEATFAATGMKIPLPVVRRTGADMHANFSDATVLTRYGWSPHNCSNFTWCQRKYYSPK